MKKCVLFDFDGTLVDSQILYDIAASKCLSEINPKYTLEYCINYFNGRGWKDIFDEIQLIEKKQDIKSVFCDALTIAKDLTEKNISPTKNARQAIKALVDNKIKIAICSNSSFDTIKQHLKICNLQEFFNDDVIFALESVENAKPHPEIYIKCINYLSANKDECLIIEDSIAGLTSASYAGIDSLFYKGGSHHVNNLKNSQNVIESIKKIKNNTLKGEIDDLLKILDYL